MSQKCADRFWALRKQWKLSLLPMLHYYLHDSESDNECALTACFSNDSMLQQWRLLIILIITYSCVLYLSVVLQIVYVQAYVFLWHAHTHPLRQCFHTSTGHLLELTLPKKPEIPMKHLANFQATPSMLSYKNQALAWSGHAGTSNLWQQPSIACVPHEPIPHRRASLSPHFYL